MHYCVSGKDFDSKDAPIFHKVFHRLQELDLIEYEPKDGKLYQATDKAQAYLEKLCNTPLPVKKWVFE